MSRPPLSVCIVAMNEEEHMEACLRSAGFADEWVVVDSRSTDRTREIAAAFGARVVERDWPGHIEQKNHALGLARHDWVLCLDADERVSPGLRGDILRALSEDPLPDGFEFPRLTRYLGRWIRHGGWYPDRKLRLFRKSKGRWTGVNPHDRVTVESGVRQLDGHLEHYSYRSLSDHLRTIDSYTTIGAREKAARGGRAGPGSMLFRPAWKFLRMYVIKAGFLDGLPGLIVAMTGSFYVFLKYAKLWELSRGSSGRSSPVSGTEATGLEERNP